MGNRAFSFAALSLVLAILASASMPAVAQAQRAIVVTNTANDGPGTLRQALLDAASGDTITFDPIVFPPDSPATITLTSTLPEITQGNLTIDASNAGVILDGSSIGDPDVDGFVVRSAGNVIRGLQILFFPRIGIHLTTSAYNTIGGDATVGAGPSGQGNVLAGNGDAGIYVGGGHNNVIVGNRIGTDASGMAALGNNAGVLLREGAQGNQIGGTTAGERNVIAANRGEGVVAMDTGTGHNVVAGNYIGTDATGSVALPNNGASGVYIGYGASHNLIGGDTRGERNIISGNGGNGVHIEGTDAIENVVSGNYIGVDASGRAALGNHSGVRLSGGARHNVIGGTTEGEKNIISGNNTNGLVIEGAGTASNTVVGNYIGADASGTTALGNAHRGVGIFWGAQQNIIGGRTPGERNIISGNDIGVGIEDIGTDSNVVIGNYIGTDANGLAALGNESGVEIFDGAQRNIIGGTTAEERNIISGNSGDGVTIGTRKIITAAHHNTVSGNYIGTDATGTNTLSNEYDGVIISQGASHNTIGGSNATPGGACSGECNLISGNGDNGVWIGGGGTVSNNVSGNYIGTNVSGTAAIPNAMSGVDLAPGTQGNLIGGNTTAGRNLVSGNGNNGINIGGSDVKGNIVSGNYIGTDVSGTAAIGNAFFGIAIGDNAQNNLVGGSNASPGGACSGDCNTISGNGQNGVWIGNNGVSNTVSGNYIGTNASGTAAIPNGMSGVDLKLGAQNNLIGGNTAAERNLISGNSGSGVDIIGRRVTGNVVRGNYIGTDATGKAELGNGGSGVWISHAALDNTIGPGNVIAYNGVSGIADNSVGATRNTLTQNAIFDNAGKAIDTSRYGTRGQLPRPQIMHVGFRTVLGTAPPNSTVELFSDDASDAQYYEGSTVVDEVGALTFRVPPDGFAEQYITATATDEDGTTSELSDPTSAQPPVLYELPGIPTPSEVSLEPKVIGMNLSLALISILFFGATAMVFNSTFEKHSSEIHAAVDGALPQRLGKWLRPKTLTSKGQLLRNWIALLALTSLIECFL